ncbi:hypothetical protein [Caballeronia sordidicola]|uniref:hypothetical protein n=1 Tax=Caballeronia sordidicola TaxID=196367 RepID=UPI00126A2A16|nr:hypothetical protein [Caballeronia sordidicola]
MVTILACYAGSGIATVDGKSPTGVTCVGGTHDGEPVKMDIVSVIAKLPHQEFQRLIELELEEAKKGPEKPDKGT